MHAYKLAFHISEMQAENMRILNQNKNLHTCGTTNRMSFIFALFPQGTPIRMIQVNVEGYYSSCHFISQPRNFNLRNPIFPNGSHPHLPNICLKERCFLPYTTHKQDCTLFFMETLSLSSKDVYLQIPLK